MIEQVADFALREVVACAQHADQGQHYPSIHWAEAEYITEGDPPPDDGAWLSGARSVFDSQRA